MTKVTPSPLIWLVALLFIPTSLWAQEDFAFYTEPAIEISVKTDSPWQYDFEISYRNLTYKEASQYKSIHLELSQTTSYDITDQHNIGLGIRYRFKEVFSESNHNEVRITEQYIYKHSVGVFTLKHRFRLEQRFREHLTWRLRYRLSTGIPLNHAKYGLEMKPNIAFLWSVTKYGKPEGEARIGSEFEQELSEHTAISLGIDYRYEDFLYAREHDLFLLAGISITI